MYLGTSLLTEVISNGATAAIATPIALGISENLGWNHMPLVMVVLIASSAKFMTPVGYQTTPWSTWLGDIDFRILLASESG